MTPDANTISLGGHILAFLVRATGEEDFERDRLDGESLSKKLLDWADSAARWDERDEVAAELDWRAAIATVADEVALGLVEEPGKWEGMLRVAALHLRSVDTSGHPLAGETLKRMPDGSELKTVRLGLLDALVRTLLPRSTSARRAEFFVTLNDWDIWRKVVGSLDVLTPSVAEFAQILSSAHQFVGHDLAAGSIIDPLLEWASRNPRVPRQAVECWRRGELSCQSVNLDVVAMLVETAVAARGADGDILDWRDSLIKDLRSRSNEESWRLAAFISCFAWPTEPPTSTGVRHTALIEQVERLPERLVGIGLSAMRRDAQEHPEAALRTCARLLAFLGPEGSATHASAAVGIAASALRSDRVGALDLELLKPLLPTLLTSSVEGSRLDSFLASLAKLDLVLTQVFLENWFEKNATAVRQSGASFAEIFSSLARELGPEREGEWVLRLALSPRRTIRALGVTLFVRSTTVGAIESHFDNLTEKEAQALCHLLAWSGAPGANWIFSVLKLVSAHPSIVDTARPILLTDAAANFPGSCAKAVQKWRQANAKSDDQNLARLCDDLEEELQRLDMIHKKKFAVAELVATRPATSEWFRQQQRLLDVTMRRAHERSIMMQLARRMPIARGGGTTMHSQQVEPTELKEVSGSMEISVAEFVDPLSARIVRMDHFQRADALLSRISEAT